MLSNSVTAPARTVEATNPKAKVLKLIAFDVGKLTLAVQIEQVHKIINLPKVHGSGLNPIGLAQIDDRDITVIDLQQRLFHSDVTETATPHSYLVLIQTQNQEVFGVPVKQTPLLLEVPTTQIRSLPESYRRADTLEIASHIAVILTPEGNQTLFLLDVEMLARR